MSRPSHRLSEEFMLDLQEGFLSPLLRELHGDCTLMLGLRGSYINIYYRGGSLLKLEQVGGGSYRAGFDRRYLMDGALPAAIELLPRAVSRRDDAEAWAAAFPVLKRAMDRYLAVHRKHEREFQQLVVRENNRSSIANHTELFITDIEHAHGDSRLDMLGVRWLSHERQRGDSLVPVIVEMKFGNQALNGTSGLREHLEDIAERLSDPSFREALSRNIESQFEQLAQLGQLEFKQCSRIERFEIARDKRPLVVLLLAGYNPRSTALLPVLQALRRFADPGMPFDLRFFVASFAGYAMHAACLLGLDEFRRLVEGLGRAGEAQPAAGPSEGRRAGSALPVGATSRETRQEK